MTEAVIIGGTGQIGRGLAAALMAAGWRVTVVSRGPAPADIVEAGVRHQSLDRETGGLDQLRGADLVADCIAYDAGHAEQLLKLQDDVGQLAVISSSSVYRDDQGRTLDEAWTNGFPHLPVPMTEDQPTVHPGPSTYSTKKVAMEHRLLDCARIPVTVLRPGAVYGPYSSTPREWFFVKRFLDGRRRVPVAYGGAIPFHTSSVGNIAAVLLAAASRPATRILNAPDPQGPNVAEMGRSIAAAMSVEAEIVGLNDPTYPTLDGLTPWLVQRPFVLSDAAARRAGYEPVETYGQAVGAVCRWLVQATEGRDWRDVFPRSAASRLNLFDYEREDALLAAA